jgi:hypothetical protein
MRLEELEGHHALVMGIRMELALLSSGLGWIGAVR